MSASTKRSAAAPQQEPIFIDPVDDPTFQSLRRLLAAPATSTQHLSLLSTDTLYGSITYYLSKLEIDHVADFVGILTASGCMWTPPPPSHSPAQPGANSSQTQKEGKVAWSTESQETTPPSSFAADTRDTEDQAAASQQQQGTTRLPQSLSAFLVSRSASISHAVAAAFDRRVALLIDSNDGSTGWRVRRALKLWIEAIVAGMTDIEASSLPESYKAARGLPIPRLAVLTGLLQGLYLLRDQRRRRRNMSLLEEMAALRATPSLALRTRPYRDFVENEWIVSLAEILDALSGQSSDVRDGAAAFIPGYPPPSSSSTGSAEDGEADDWEKEFQKRTAQLAGSAQITALASQSDRLRAVQEIQDVPLFLAAQLAPLMPDRKLQALNTEQLARVASEALLSLFDYGDSGHDAGQAGYSFLSSLPQDAHIDADDKDVRLDPGCTTVQRAQRLVQTTLFPSLGPLSKLLSKALAREATFKDPASLGLLLLGVDHNNDAVSLSQQRGCAATAPILVRMDRLAKELERSWLSSPLAGVAEAGIAEASRVHTTQLWTIFKTLLFSYTMAFDSLLDAILQMCPSPTVTFPPAPERSGSDTASSRWPPANTSNLPPAYVQIVQSILEIFSHLYWITSSFGAHGFDVYRKVFLSALDVLGRDGEGCVALLERIRPDDSPSLATETNSARRSLSTYFLDVAEQLLPALPDEVIEQLLLPTCRPYLEDTQYREAFESAHSVALAVYTHRKRSMFDLAPFYTDLLIRCYPTRLDETQLEFAVTMVVAALADKSDSVCWWVVERVAKEIDDERQRESDSGKGKANETGRTGAGTELTATDPAAEPTRTELLQSVSDSASPSPATSARSTAVADKAAIYPRRVTLQLVLIACVPCVNLVLLRSILSKVEGYIVQHKTEETESVGKGYRNVLCEKTFEALQALNAATREEGVRWWLDKREVFGA